MQVIATILAMFGLVTMGAQVQTDAPAFGTDASGTQVGASV